MTIRDLLGASYAAVIGTIVTLAVLVYEKGDTRVVLPIALLGLLGCGCLMAAARTGRETG